MGDVVIVEPGGVGWAADAVDRAAWLVGCAVVIETVRSPGRRPPEPGLERHRNPVPWIA
ncbi:hypothetical protein [Gordonia terrae]